MKRLCMRFETSGEKTATINVYDVKEDITEEQVSALMDKIVANDIFYTSSGSITGKKDAKLVDVTETELNVE